MGLREEYREYREDLARTIRKHILASVEAHPVGLAPYVADRFGMHRPYVYKELRRMVTEGILAVEGMTLKRCYTLLKFPARKAPPEPPPSQPFTPIERERLAWQNRKRWR